MAIKPIGLRTLMAAVLVSALVLAGLAWHDRRMGRVREAARRAQCINNLKQIGLAIATYEATLHAYPPGTIANGSIPLDRRLGWGSQIYDFCTEHQSGYTGMDFGLPWDDPRVEEHSRTQEGMMMRCPSGPRWTPAAPILPASYVGIAGLGPDAPGLPVTHRRAGIFGDDRRVTPADVKDGLANTMMVAETAQARGPWYAGGRATVRGVDPALRPQVGQGRPFGGVHGEGANVLMADGSVRWVRPTPTSAGFEAMSTIAGGEVVADPDDSPR